jgi:hypothetical protein
MQQRASRNEVLCTYEVIGELLSDPTQLLVVGDDGQFYALNLVDGQTKPAEISEDWHIDTCRLPEKAPHIRFN